MQPVPVCARDSGGSCFPSVTYNLPSSLQHPECPFSLFFFFKVGVSFALCHITSCKTSKAHSPTALISVDVVVVGAIGRDLKHLHLAPCLVGVQVHGEMGYESKLYSRGFCV